MKNTNILAVTLGGALLLNGMTPMQAEADQSAELAELKQMMQNQAAEISALRQEVSVLKKKPAASAQPVDVRELEQQIAVLAENQENHEDSLADKIDIHASLSQGYLLSDANNWVANTEDGSFGYNEFALNASYQISDKLRAGLQFMSRDFGPLMNNKVYLDWAILDYSWRDELGVRFGRLKTAYGLHNESRDIDGARISILLPQSVYTERNRDLFNGVDGAGLHGVFDMGRIGTMSYQAALGQHDFDKEDGTAKWLEALPYIATGSISSISSPYLGHAQLDYATPIEGLRLMASYLAGEVTLQAITSAYNSIPDAKKAVMEMSDYSEWTASVEYTWNNLIIAGEYREVTNPDQEFFIDGNLTRKSNGFSESWYVSTSYRFADWFAAEVYYSEYSLYFNDKGGEFYVAMGQDDFLSWQKDLAFTGRFDINDNWIFKAGVTFSDGLATGLSNDYPVAGIAEQDWILYSLKTTVSF